MGIGIWELVIILLIIVLVFGAGKLPELGVGIGKMVRGFKNELNDKPQGDKSENDKN